MCAALGTKGSLDYLITLCSPVDVKTLLAGDVGGLSILHGAARAGNISQIPKGLLTVDQLLKRDNKGNTVAHVAAYAGFLNQIPEELLTEPVLLSRDSLGDMPFHNAAYGDFLCHVPKSFLTEENLLRKNHAGESVFKMVAPNFDRLLGLEFSENVVEFVGADWYSKNQQFCKTKAIEPDVTSDVSN